MGVSEVVEPNAGDVGEGDDAAEELTQRLRVEVAACGVAEHPVVTYAELIERDKVSLDVFWLRDESLEDTDNLRAPGVIAAEIVEDLEAALAEFRALAESLANVGVEGTADQEGVD